MILQKIFIRIFLLDVIKSVCLFQYIKHILTAYSRRASNFEPVGISKPRLKCDLHVTSLNYSLILL